MLILIAVAVQAVELPSRPSGPVADYAKVLDASASQEISLMAQALWEQAEFGLVVATFPSLEGEEINDFATRLYEKWEIGLKGRDEGALLLLSLNPRKIRIETGYGTEAYLNDAKAGRLLDQYGVPHFRANDFSSGLLALSGAIASLVAQEKNIQLAVSISPPPGQNLPSGRAPGLIQLVPLILIIILLSSTRFGRAMLLGMLLSGMMGGRGRGGFGGGFGSGGFGGGFGGGMSGGGGASRGF